jgi:2-keto-4-pentenoate hydratase/2-oxohepta-3-ene-1,7-dioic acid hydratase in catechol pathway/regulator of RNase E activity RraA
VTPPPPTKIVAVHVNYRSRAAERGATPSYPSYFFKPPSSISGDGATVERPHGCELLAYEGEIAVVIGRRARRVDAAEAWSHVSHVAAANDLGVYDLRYADRGSNVHSKGWDGCTPLGPLADATGLDPAALRIVTRVNGTVVQEGRTDELLFSLPALVADVSSTMTLEPGDILLTGTPAGSRPIEPGDVVEVELSGAAGPLSTVRTTIGASTEPLSAIGPVPKVTAADRAAALGTTAPQPIELTDELRRALTSVSTATLTSQLQRRGIRSTYFTGLRPLQPGRRLLGYAYTLRYVPQREDLLDQLQAGLNAQKRAVESIGPDEVLVIEAREQDGAGTIGDILAMRAFQRGAAGIVTDGCVRDSPSLGRMEMPVYARAPHAATLGRLHLPLDANVPIACAGVLVMPGDLVVGDDEGAMVLPAALAEEVARDAVVQEEQETFALERVTAGESIVGLYPLADARRSDFETWRSHRDSS